MITFKCDKDISIATGHSRKTLLWNNQKLLWSHFVSKLEITTRTREPFKEYLAMNKDQQSEIKDVGGFVGGWLKDRRRLAGNIVSRSLITLDADFADDNLISILEILFGDMAYVIYSTHKHSKEKARLRIIFPLAKSVKGDAFQAISRKIAFDLGLDYFDDTTHESERLMYWPSTAADGDYFFEYNDGDWLDPDKILSTYDDWREVSTWTESKSALKNRQSNAKKQGDPLTKSGIIGAFCRTYTIQQAIEVFLHDIYEVCAIPDRYTFSGGSTAAGLVLYEDKFAYSHHGTDPIGGLLVNSFDLVRIHRFGEKDIDTCIDTPINKLPSYQAMCELAAKDDEVKAKLVEDKIAEAQEDFSEDLDENWAKNLKIDKYGRIESTSSNILVILEHDPLLKGTIAFNDFSNRCVLIADLPWRKKELDLFWNDKDDSGLRNYLSKIYEIKGKQVIDDAFNEILIRKHFHPVRNYLRDLEWDGINRIDTLWIDYLGAIDSEYTRTVTRKHIVAAVARVMTPGCKFDNVLVLCGPQGIGKSSMLKKLGGEWFSDSISAMQGKEAYEQLHGVWIVEMGEMWATRKSETEAVKHFLAKQEDIFRVAYGRRVSVFPRQCVFYGTTNDSIFLRDRTGNRRFWPVMVGKQEVAKSPFKEFDRKAINQIWAEAYKLWSGGETIYLDNIMTKEAAKIQAQHTEESEKTGMIIEYLETLLPTNWAEMDLYQRRECLAGDELHMVGTETRNKVCALEVWCELFNGDPKNFSGINSREISDILRNLENWTAADSPRQFGKIYGKQRCFVHD